MLQLKVLIVKFEIEQTIYHDFVQIFSLPSCFSSSIDGVNLFHFFLSLRTTIVSWRRSMQYQLERNSSSDNIPFRFSKKCLVRNILLDISSLIKNKSKGKSSRRESRSPMDLNEMKFRNPFVFNVDCWLNFYSFFNLNICFLKCNLWLKRIKIDRFDENWVGPWRW